MTTRTYMMTAAALLLSAGPAFAHAHLRSAQPAVDGTAHLGIQEIRITYSEAIELQFCEVSVTGSNGQTLEADALTTDPADAKILVLRFAHPLTPDTYKVDWHATSVDTHKTEGTYNFKIEQ